MTKKKEIGSQLSLQEQYSATTYLVFHNKSTFELKENSLNSDFDIFLKQKKLNAFALITSDNPFSTQFSKAKNLYRRKELKLVLKKLGLKFIRASSRPNSKTWKPEEGFCVFNLDFGTALLIGFLFDQNAIVYGETGKQVRIPWCEDLAKYSKKVRNRKLLKLCELKRQLFERQSKLISKV